MGSRRIAVYGISKLTFNEKKRKLLQQVQDFFQLLVGFKRNLDMAFAGDVFLDVHLGAEALGDGALGGADGVGKGDFHLRLPVLRAFQGFLHQRFGLADGEVVFHDLLIPGLISSTDENILAMKQKAQRNMEIAIAATAIVYTLNFIDAMVDAHLYYFDVSDDLSLFWSPMLLSNPINTSPSYGVSVVLSFK